MFTAWKQYGSQLGRTLGAAVLFLVGLVASASAQLNQDWESGMGEWQVTGGLWETGFPSPSLGPAPHGGSQCVGTGIASTYSDRADTRLVSPAFAVPAASQEPRLRFWHWYETTDDAASVGNDGCRVQIRRMPAGAWENLPLEDEVEFDGSSFGGTGLSARWALVSLDLRAYAGADVEIAFWFTSNTTGTNRAGWYIDDVSVVTGRAPSLAEQTTTWDADDEFPSGWHAPRGAWEVGRPTLESQEPTGTYSGERCVGTVLGDVYPDKARARLISPIFKVPAATERPRLEFLHWYRTTNDADSEGNDGGRVQIRRVGGIWEPLPLEDRVEFDGSSHGGAGQSSRWALVSIDLTPYADADVEISFHFTSNTTGTNQVGWYIDDVRVATGAPPSPAVASVDWEAGDVFPDGWQAPSGIWEVGTPSRESGEPTEVHSGTRCVGTSLGRDYPDGANTRLISPLFQVPAANQSPRLRFWHWYDITNDAASFGNDGGRVQIRRRGGIWETLAIEGTTLEFDGSSNGGVGPAARWSPVSIDLSAYGGDEVEISFQFSSNTTGTNREGWYIDDIEVVSGEFVVNDPETWDGFADHPADWSAPFGTWEVGVPATSVGTTSAPNCVGTRIGTNYPQNVTPVLISPRVRVPADQPVVRLSSWHALDGGDNCRIRIRRPGDASWTNLRTMFGSSSGWQQIEESLDDYADDVVEISFQLISNNTGNQGLGWYIDDFAVTTGGDTECPTASVSPSESSVLESTTPTITVTFSESVQNVESGLRATMGGTSLPSSTTATSETVYEFTILNGLSPGDSFALEIPSSITDAAGNAFDGNGDGVCGDGSVLEYSIEDPGDTTPPTVTDVLPLDSEQDVQPTRRIDVVFSEPVTGVEGSLSVQGTISGAIRGEISSDDSVIWTFDPNGIFASGETVTCTLGASIVDLAGNALDGNADGTGGDGFTWSFSVAERVDTDPVEDPTTGHVYQVISAALTWPEARAAAAAMVFDGRSGHLVAINSAAENAFLTETFGAEALHMHWIGGFQESGGSEPAGAWTWVTDEPFNYQNWGSGEPDDLTPNENALAFDHSSSADGKEWNDLQSTRQLSGYVVEFGRSSLPSCTSVSMAYGESFPARRYFLLSIPVDFVEEQRLADVLDDLGQMGSDKWQGYGVRAGNVERNPIVEPGSAYWVATKDDVRPMTVNGCALAGPVQVSLDASGWYAIGVPDLGSSSSWSTVDVTASGSTNAFGFSSAVAPNVWWWQDSTDDLDNDGEYRTGDATTLWRANPWGGYLVYANEACDLEFPAIARADEVARLARTPRQPEPAWALGVTLHSDEGSGGRVRVGSRQGSLAGYDRGDVLKPPFVGDGSRIAVIQRDFGWVEFMEAFAPLTSRSDGASRESFEWELRCTSTGAGHYARLEGDLEALPDELHAYVRDEQGTLVADLGQEGTYEFFLDQERTFTLVVTPEDLSFEMPTTKWVQVGPNPTSGAVNIAFEAARSGRLTLRIFDVTGRVVEVLADERLDRGAHARTWNAADSNVPAGIYFARIETGSDALTRKITVVK